MDNCSWSLASRQLLLTFWSLAQLHTGPFQLDFDWKSSNQHFSVYCQIWTLKVYVTTSLLGALRPGSPTFSESNQRDVRKRGKGPTQDPRINIAESPKKFLGITRFGEILDQELGSCASCRGAYCLQEN